LYRLVTIPLQMCVCHRPLIYLFSRDHESTASVKMAMDCLQSVATTYFDKRLVPGVSVTDMSNGLRSGMQHIHENASVDSGEESEDEGVREREDAERVREGRGRQRQSLGSETEQEEGDDDDPDDHHGGIVAMLSARGTPHMSDWAHIAGSRIRRES
jgi:hypothetical protein